MRVITTKIPGCFELQTKLFNDNRGIFVKTYHNELFKELGLNTIWAEEYYSISHKNVIRGLHFQLPPFDHEKLVYCVNGQVLDVVVDLRKDSPTYKHHIKLILNSDVANMIYVPKGCAHGFRSLVDNSIMCYKVSTTYNQDADFGVLWDSCGIDWQHDNEIIMSLRDQTFESLDKFNSPF